MNNEIQVLKNNLLFMAPRTFGEKFGEKLLFKIFPTLSKRIHNSHDALEDGYTTEIKLSRVMNKSKEGSLFENILEESTISFLDLKSAENFDCNIQQVKPDYFERIIYGIFFDDIILLFKTTSDVIVNDNNIQYSNKQHRGNTGEGQFHIKRKNLQYHIDNFLFKKITWDKLLDIIKKS